MHKSRGMCSWRWPRVCVRPNNECKYSVCDNNMPSDMEIRYRAGKLVQPACQSERKRTVDENTLGQSFYTCSKVRDCSPVIIIYHDLQRLRSDLLKDSFGSSPSLRCNVHACVTLKNKSISKQDTRSPHRLGSTKRRLGEKPFLRRKGIPAMQNASSDMPREA